MTETLIKSAAPYYLLRQQPVSGRSCYVIARDGRVISRTFSNKRNAERMLRLVARRMLSDSQWLYCMNGLYGHCSQ